MLMEEENVLSSLPDSVLQLPQQESWTSGDHPYPNGEQGVIVWGETEVQLNQAHGTDELSPSPKAGRDTPEEAEEWEQIVWPVRPMTCTSPPISLATVQWDMPDFTAEALSPVTDSDTTNELDYAAVTSVDATSSSSQDVKEEVFTQEVREEEDDSQVLSLNPETTANCSEACDVADVQEPTAQEKEDSSAHELLDNSNEIPPRTDSEVEEGHSASVDLNDILEDAEDSGDETADSFVDLTPEDEREEPDVLLTGQGDSEEERTSSTGVETEEDNEEGGEAEEWNVTNVVSSAEESGEAESVSCLGGVETPTELQQSDDSGLTINPDQLTDQFETELLVERRQSGSEEDVEVLERSHEDPTRQSKQLEMCTDVAQNVEPEQSEAEHDDQGASIEAAVRIEDSQTIELTEKPEETSCLQHQDCDQTTEEAESEQPEVREEPEQVQTGDQSGQNPELSPQMDMTIPPENAPQPECEQLEQVHTEELHSEDQSEQHLDPSPQTDLTEESTRAENAVQAEESTHTVCVKAEDPAEAEQQEQTEASEQSRQMTDSSQPTDSEQPVGPVETNESEVVDQMPAGAEVTQQTAELRQAETEEVGGGSVQAVVANGTQHKPPETAASLTNGGKWDQEMAQRLAEQLFKLDGIQRVDVVKHIDKDNDFSRAVGKEFLNFFDFTGQTLDHALRSFLKVVLLIGETQERERVLQSFACRFHQCNPDTFSSSGAVLALTCALMLLNTDLHGQNVGKAMSSSKFVSNLDGMNEGENFSKDLLKSLYNSIKSEPLEWAVDEEELKRTMLANEDATDEAPLRSKANPLQDVPNDKMAQVVKEGFLQRKLLADVDGKRTPWGKRGWKTFYGGLRGMVLYLQKDYYRKEQWTNEEILSVHHSLAEQAADYTKRPHVFRLQTADMRIFLFQASSKVEMNSWISRINLVSALHSAPPFPAAVGSQRRFFRPILPASQSAHTLDRQLQSHTKMLESFKADLSYLQQNQPEGKKAKARELEEHRVRAEYLHHEMSRYEIYIHVLEVWKNVKKNDDDVMAVADLSTFDKEMCADSIGEADEEEGLKKSHSSPSLELELVQPSVIKVRRNISERRTYRRTIVPRWNKEA